MYVLRKGEKKDKQAPESDPGSSRLLQDLLFFCLALIFVAPPRWDGVSFAVPISWSVKITQLTQIKTCEGKRGDGCWDTRRPVTTNGAENKAAPRPPAAPTQAGPLLAVPS